MLVEVAIEFEFECNLRALTIRLLHLNCYLIDKAPVVGIEVTR